MIISGAFDYVDVLKQAADFSWKRNEVLNNNIANVDTPGYKREDVTFSSYLSSEMRINKIVGSKSALHATVDDIMVNGLDYRVYKDYSGMSYRIDQNNVDIDTENVELAANQLLYNGIVDSMSAEFSRIGTAIKRKRIRALSIKKALRIRTEIKPQQTYKKACQSRFYYPPHFAGLFYAVS